MPPGVSTPPRAGGEAGGEGFLSPSDLEAVARLLLQDRPIRVVAGAWWSYYPERNEVAYPPNLLAEWPSVRSIGALCHEIAEVLYSGSDAVAVFRAFGDAAEAVGVERTSADLLLNAINDLRVNRLYLQAYPGARRFLAGLYRAETLVPKTDVPGRRGAPLPHHHFLDAITVRWAAALHGATAPAIDDDRVRRAVELSWPALSRAVESDALVDLADLVRREVLPVYRALLGAGKDQTQNAETADPEDLDPPPRTSAGEEEEGGEGLNADDLQLLARNSPMDDGPAESWVLLTDESHAAESESNGHARPAPAAPPGDHRPPPSPPGAAWSGGIVQKFRRVGRRSQTSTAYEDFKYLEAVRRLGPQIDAVLHGSPGRDGLIAILNRRRFGTFDPWRRPRRRRHGDSGDIDSDRPENLLLTPSLAFLKGQRQNRDDSQKDFAHAILLDVSGSVVQRGYRSRKFDQLIDTLVVFCEIHERLKLPYELIAFSDRARVLRSFDQCQYDNLQIEPSSAHVVKDLSDVVVEMYRAEHGETHETHALDGAVADLVEQRGLKTIFMVTDGVSSDRIALTERLVDLERRNLVVPPSERLQVLAFGLGLAEDEFNLSYQPEVDGQPIQCSSGKLVPNVDALPTIVCDAVDKRIRAA